MKKYSITYLIGDSYKTEIIEGQSMMHALQSFDGSGVWHGEILCVFLILK